MARVLVVEDDLQLKLTYDIILNKEGHTVERAGDGIEALAKAESFKPDLILLDLLMPRMNGLEFLRKYDVKNKHPNVKVIVFSNMSMPAEMEEAHKLGATKYMLKSSTSPKQLAELIAGVLATKSDSPPTPAA